MALVNIVNLVGHGGFVVVSGRMCIDAAFECTFSLSLSLSHGQTVLDNPTCFLNPFQFEITFECLQELDDGRLLFVAVLAAVWIMLSIRTFVSLSLTCCCAAVSCT